MAVMMALRDGVAKSASSGRKTTVRAHRFDGLPLGVVEQNRRQQLTHVPFRIGGEHAEDDMRAQPQALSTPAREL